MLDKKAKRILLGTYWGGGGWRAEPRVGPDDLAYAKEKGLMFDAVTLDHDRCVRDVLAVRARLSPLKPYRAFLASLAIRRPDWRSGAASYVLAGRLSPHSYRAVVSGQSFAPDGATTHTSYRCGGCAPFHGAPDGPEVVDLNILSFERIKWGGVRHGDLTYAWLDLRCLEEAEVPEPTPEDLRIFGDILATVLAADSKAFPGTLERSLAAVLPSTRDERRQLIEILACIGVLRARAVRPIETTHDWSFAEDWRGEDSYDRDAVRTLFGSWMS